MYNITSKLNGIEKRLNKVPEIDPEEAIHVIGEFIDLAYYEDNVPEDKTIDYSYFANWVEKIMSVEPEIYKSSKQEMWQEMEKAIREKHGFKEEF